MKAAEKSIVDGDGATRSLSLEITILTLKGLTGKTMRTQIL